MKYPCDVIQDLIPLVEDGVASETSKKIVQEHIRHCESCASLLHTPIDSTINEKQQRQVLKKIKYNLQFLYFALLLTTSVVCYYFMQNGVMLFFSAIVIPFASGIAYFINTKKWYQYILQFYLFSFVICIFYTVYNLIHYPPETNVIQTFMISIILFPIPFVCLSLIGIGIAFLLKYAFGKE